MKFLILLGLLSFTAPVFAQPVPPLPAGPPEFVVDPGMVERESATLMTVCRESFEKGLKKKGAKTSDISKKAREVCFCIVKDVKRREDVSELQFLAKSYKGKISNEAPLSEDEQLWLHELDNTEGNCRLNSKYRFGDEEPTFSDKTKKAESSKEAGEKNAKPKSQR